MANRSLEALKAYFFEHAYPTWQQFHDVLDSFRHKSDKIPITDVDGLAEQLNDKVSASMIQTEAQLRSEADEAILLNIQSEISAVNDEINTKISPKPVSATVPYTIGQHVDGGVVFYELQPADHGYEAGKQKCLIASLEDRSDGVQWSPGYAVTAATETAIGYGLANTLTILDNHLSVEWYAAKLCSYTPDAGYSDWYLGTLEEMMMLAANKDAAGITNLAYSYWTSSETAEQYANLVYTIPIPAFNSTQKNQSYAVRAIRTSVLDLGSSLPADNEIIVASGDNGKEVKGSGTTVEAINAAINTKENTGIAAQLISDLKAGVPAAGDTLLKLFNEIGLKINRTETLTATEIQLLISNLVDSAPATLDTLNELAAALANDPNFATTITTLIGTKLNASKAAIEALLTGLISTHYHTASATTFAPVGSIVATNVQSAIAELDSEKASVTQYNSLVTSINEVKQLAGISDGWVGRRWNPTQPGTQMTLINSVVVFEDFFSKFKVVALDDNGQEIATLATGNGAMSGDLTGANGQVMLKIPQIYYREIFNLTGQRCGIDLSLTPVSGFKLHEKFSWGNGRGEIYVGCFEGGEVAAKMTSVAGVPVSTSKTIAQFRELASARGAGWHAYDYYTHHLLEMLFYVYHGTLNSQEALPGYTDHTWGEVYKKNTGLVTTMHGRFIGQDDGQFTSSNHTIANSFLGIENLYGHVWKFLDGCVFDGRVGKQNTAYLTPNPLLFSSVDSEILSRYINMNVDLPAATYENYLSSTGALGLPKTHGGDSSTYVTDYFWSYLDNIIHDYLRVVIAGGGLNYGTQAGVAARDSLNGLGIAFSNFASRLCYEKN